MAIASANVSSIGRSGGRSATAAAAYRTGQKIPDHRTGEIHDYTRKTGVESVAMFLPEGAPVMTTAELWNLAESAENRKNSQVARELLVALPHELNDQQRRELVSEISSALVQRYGVAAEASIHRPDSGGDQRNHHAHIMFTTRRMAADGTLGAKTRELDVKPSSSAEVTWMRQMVEITTNGALELAGLDERIDMRSLEDQHAAALAAGDEEAAAAADRLPTVHEGPVVTQMRRRGGSSQVANINDARRSVNAQRAELRKVEAQIHQIEEARARRAAEVSRLHGQLRAYLRDGLDRGWIARDQAAQAVRRALDCGVKRAELAEVVAEISDLQAQYNWQQHHQQASAARAPDESDADVHDDASEWIEQRSDDGLLGWYADTPDEVYLYDEQAATWIKHDPRPMNGPRMG